MPGLILLAAGASTRLGKPKQELLFEGSTLLQRAIQTATSSACAPVVLVLAPDSDFTLPESVYSSIIITHNPEWEEGMASSIRCGLTVLLAEEPGISSCIFMVCDQPFVEAALLDAMVQTRLNSDKEIIACAYRETLGTPVLFDKSFFPDLLALRGQEGAKKVVYRHKDALASVPFHKGAIDIDTAEDYDSLIRSTPDTPGSLL